MNMHRGTGSRIEVFLGKGNAVKIPESRPLGTVDQINHGYYVLVGIDENILYDRKLTSY